MFAYLLYFNNCWGNQRRKLFDSRSVKLITNRPKPHFMLSFRCSYCWFNRHVQRYQNKVVHHGLEKVPFQVELLPFFFHFCIMKLFCSFQCLYWLFMHKEPLYMKHAMIVKQLKVIWSETGRAIWTENGYKLIFLLRNRFKDWWKENANGNQHWHYDD